MDVGQPHWLWVPGTSGRHATHTFHLVPTIGAESVACVQEVQVHGAHLPPPVAEEGLHTNSAHVGALTCT